ncbi:ERF family protein [Rhodococcus sp. NPDC004095]
MSKEGTEAPATTEAPSAPAEKQPANLQLIPPAIAAALVKLQGEVKTIIKGAKNDHFGNTYAELKDVQTMALPLLSKHGLALTQWPRTEGGKHYLRSYLVHTSGVGMVDDIDLLLTKNDPQGLGSAITYQRRQTTMAILGLSAEDDDDGNKAANRQSRPTADQISEVRQLCVDLKYPPDQVAARLVSLRTEDHATVAIANLRKNVSERAKQINGENDAIPVFTGSRDQVVPIEVTNKAREKFGISTDDESTVDNLQSQMVELPISQKGKRSLVRHVTGKPFLRNCTHEERVSVAEAIDAIKAGTFEIPPEWDEPDVTPPEATA